MIKLTILETFIKNTFRIIKGETYKDIIHHAKQYSSGGDDYSPPKNTECIASTLNNNDCETVVILYNDKTARISQPGEKRIYSTDENGKEIKATIHLKNNGNIEITANNNITINAENINATAKNIEATAENININSECNINGNCNLVGSGGMPVLTTNTVILDSLGNPCTITNPAIKVKAV